MTANEKAQTEGLSGLKKADSRAAAMVFGCLRPMQPGGRRNPSGQGEGHTVIRLPGGQDAQQPRKASSDQEGAEEPTGTDGDQESAEWLRMYPGG